MQEELVKGKTTGSLRLGSVSTRLRQVAELAERLRGRALTTLHHHIDLAWLYEAHRRTRKSGAPGVDRQSAKEYSEELDSNLRSLLDRFKSGRYRAPAVRGVEIPKGDGRVRRIGVPSFEDKVLQRAVSMILEAVYEQEFLDCSYGCRPRRSAHDALQHLWDGLMELQGGWVIDLDLRDFFESLDHGLLREMLDQRVRDGVIRRQMDKWLKAGVLEASGRYRRSERGTPQGGVISPWLANLYLHEVVDEWFEREVRPRLRGRAFLVRYVDDVVLVFTQRRDAQRVLEVLPKRLARYGLALNREKTRLVHFERPPRGRRPGGQDRPGSFDFLGLTHLWGRSRKGNWVVQRRTSRERFRRTLRGITTWLRRHRHLPVPVQQRILCRALEGHYRYYGVTGNWARVSALAYRVRKAWYKWLRRRSQRGLSWPQYLALLSRHPLAPPCCYASIYRRPRRAARLLA